MSHHTPPFRHAALATAALAALLAGCAAPPPAPKAWRVEPSYRISNTGPSAAPGYVALAKQYEGERRWRDASDAWRKASLEAPDDVDVLNALGTAEAGQGRYREAIAALRRAVALAPERAQLLNNLGFALMLDGLAAEAAAVFRDALVRDPTHRLARANLERAEQSALAKAPVYAESDRLTALGLGPQGHAVSAIGASAIAASTVADAAAAAPASTPSIAATPNAATAAAVTTRPAQPADARLQSVANVAALQVSGAGAAETAGRGAGVVRIGYAPDGGTQSVAFLVPAATPQSQRQAPQPASQPGGDAPSPQPQPLPTQVPMATLRAPAPVESPSPLSASATTYRIGFGPEARAEAPAAEMPAQAQPASTTVSATASAPVSAAVFAPMQAPAPTPAIKPTPEPEASPLPARHALDKPTTASLPDRAALAPRAPALARMPTLTLASDRPEPSVKGALQPRVEIANGNGVNGMAARLSGFLRSRGVLQHAALSNLAPFNAATSVVYYRPGFAAAAKALADRAPYRIEVAAAPGGATGNADLRVVLGRDVRLAASCERNCVIADASTDAASNAAPNPAGAAAQAQTQISNATMAVQARTVVAGALADRLESPPDDESAPDRPSPLVAAWLAVLAR